MSAADDIELRRQLYGTGRRVRSKAEARAELVTACSALGDRAREWRVDAYIPEADLAIVDGAVEGIRRLLTELRAPEAGHDAA